MKVFTYYCRGCSLDVLSGALTWVCPHCKGSLQLLRVNELDSTAYPDMDKAMEDVMEGIEELLGAN